ncbi:AI-2E family transporter [Halomonas heilongjiangensis]|uniref:AI-2E family transporter n=1 Tax=Halomonas heilongjiangensis TaxID=1387883 RepID=A0A2N7TPJ0_9GAMM|nr:AI-2E family transporter [Halomonas heilongjiangensis]PMR70095.1 AI-2E family transporter [Halomonas heilongjiangensis]PXX94459.1 AI-2E family transporter [Halomonas heilongjiangensis]
MSSEKTTYIEFAPGEKRLLRYTILALSAVTLVSTIGFIIWVLGQIIGALHALVFPLAIAGVMALVLFPVVELFERHLRMNRLGAVVSLFVILFGLFLTVMVLVLPTAIYQGSQFFQSVPEIAQRGHESLSARFPKALPILEDAITEMEIQSMLPDAEEAADRTMSYIGFLVGLGFVPLYLFFALLSGNRMKAYARAMLFLFTQKRQNEVVYLGQLFIDYLTAFFRGQLTIALIMGVMMAVGFTVIGLEAAIYIGLALGLLNIVPYLGFIVGVITVLPIAYLQPAGGTQLVMLVLAVIAVTQLVESVLLTPKIMADRSGLHPALVVISILFWGTALGGVVGMILAVPLTAFLLTLGKHVKSRLPTTIWTDEIDRQILIETTGDDDRHS